MLDQSSPREDNIRRPVLGPQVLPVLPAPNTSPTIGVYNVKSGSVLHPATVNPSTLRSFSTSHNSFKPANGSLMGSLVFEDWSPPLPASAQARSLPATTRREADEPDTGSGRCSGSSGAGVEPGVDESGYATLLIKREPFYEQVPSEQVNKLSMYFNMYNVHISACHVAQLTPINSFLKVRSHKYVKMHSRDRERTEPMQGY